MKKSKKYFDWNKVTTLPRCMAMVLFVMLPFIGFILGMKYQQKRDSSNPVVAQTTPTVKPTPSPSPSINCGDIPDSVKVIEDHFTVVNGPMWSPDCKHIAWSVWQSTFLNPDIPEGLFLYDVITRTTNRVYKAISGRNHQETTELTSWKDNNSIIFTKTNPGSLFIYDLITNNVQEL